MCCGKRKPISNLKRTRSGLKKRLQNIGIRSATSNGEPTPNNNFILPENQEEKEIHSKSSLTPPYDVQSS